MGVGADGRELIEVAGAEPEAAAATSAEAS
jgi:hypothetical protein